MLNPLFAIGLLALTVSFPQGVSKKPQRKAPSTTGAPASVLWKAVVKSSEGYSDMVVTEGRAWLDDDLHPDQEGDTRLTWELTAQSEPEAKMKFKFKVVDVVARDLDLVPLANVEYQALRLKLNQFPDLATLSRNTFILRPKDQTTFEQIVAQEQLLGDRSLGRMIGSLSQYFLVLTISDFQFNEGKAEFPVRIASVLYGGKTYEMGGMQLGAIDASERAFSPFLKRARAALLEQRSILAKAASTSGQN